jgi:hypothetical protein
MYVRDPDKLKPTTVSPSDLQTGNMQTINMMNREGVEPPVRKVKQFQDTVRKNALYAPNADNEVSVDFCDF